MLEIVLIYAVILICAAGLRLVWPFIKEPTLTWLKPRHMVTEQVSEPIANIETNPWEERCAKLEVMLQEKNRIIAQLEERLNAEHLREKGIERIKNILDEQILELREQNRVLRMQAEGENRLIHPTQETL